jgi:hypothetical protein
MKLRILIILLSFCGSTASAQDAAEIKTLFWGAADTYKSAGTIPDKWKNESAVVIYKNINYDFHKYGSSVTYITSVRKRIKLLDQAAVAEFSEFSFKDSFQSSKGRGSNWMDGTNIMGVKVIKPDGSEKEVNIDEEAVTMDEGKKIAIANLEPGDILDFYYHSTEPFKSKEEYGFEPVEATLGDEYPIMNLKITFKTEDDFFVNFNTYNSAPELKEISPAGSAERRYELTASDIEKNDFPRWFYPLAELPSYKFQVYFARSGKFEGRASAFLPKEESAIKKTVSKEDVLGYYEKKFWPEGDLKAINQFLKSHTFASDEEKVKEVYYYTRHQYYTRYVEAFVLKEAQILDLFFLYGTNAVFFTSERQFINHFMAFLRQQEIDYDIMVGTDRENGPIKDLLIEGNAVVLLRVNTQNPVYLQFFTPFTNADQISAPLENSDAYLLKVSKGKKVTDIETVKLPLSTWKDNVSIEKVNVTLSGDFSALDVTRESSQYGHNKDYDQDDKMYFFDFVQEDFDKYETPPILEALGNKKKIAQYTKEFDALKSKLRDKQKEAFEKSAEEEFGFEIDDHALEITNTGRFGKADPFTIKESFTVKNNLLKKAGPNYIFEIGRLIGQQAQLEEKEYKRKNNIYTPFPRSFDEEIVLTIPEGYTVAGLDKLNKRVENATGGFISTAKVEGNRLIIKANKYYSNYFEPNANWKDMVAFLDTAYQFTQEKILLKKKP